MTGAPGNFSQDSIASGGSVAPGFAFGKRGVVSNAFLLANDVVSDDTGFPIKTTGSTITYIAVSNSQVSTFDVELYEHDGTTFTLLATATVTSSRTGDFTPVTPIAITTGKELAAKVSSGSCKDQVVLVFSTGDVPA